MSGSCMRKSSALKKGDAVALVAPASPVLATDLQTAIRSLKYLSLDPVIYPSCRLQGEDLWGNEKQQAKDLTDAFCDPSIKGIFCLRGGYGSIRALEQLDYEAISANPKVFVGADNITLLHIALQKKSRIVTLYGPMPSQFYGSLDASSLSDLKQHLYGGFNGYGAEAYLQYHTSETWTPGIACGRVTGGSISALASTLGSDYEIDSRNCLLFLDEKNEPLHRIETWLVSLALAGKLRDCSGIVLGSFEGCYEEGLFGSVNFDPLHLISKLHTIYEAVIEPFGKPTITGISSGHSVKGRSLPLGAKGTLDAFEGTLILNSMLTVKKK